MIPSAESGPGSASSLPGGTLINRTPLSYRPDIDGLRAIAVLSVIIYHLEPTFLPGGFAGVDIFFVISGYLITGILLRGIVARDFSLREFYRRRIKRILPAMSLVIVCSLLVGQFVLLPTDLERLAGSAVWAQLFAGNVYFTYFLDTNYFAADSDLEPLLHLWSLGVEEQFYLLWPLLLLCLYRMGHGALLAIVVVLSVASFAFGQYYFERDPLFSYYMLPARAGTLLAGALCALPGTRKIACSASQGEFMVLVGLGLLAFSLFFIGSQHVFPGFNAIPVALGTALVIHGGGAGNRLSAVLGRPLPVAIGLLSYSLYLWHWPVLAFLKYGYPNPGFGLQLSAVVVIVALSWLSYRFVEVPCRASNEGFGHIARRQLLLPSLLIIGLGLWLSATGGFGVYGSKGAYAQALASVGPVIRRAPSAANVCQSSRLTAAMLQQQECRVGPAGLGGEPGILLWGDSNAGHYVGTLQVLARRYGFSFRNIAHAACPPLLEAPETFTHANARGNCAHSAALVTPELAGYDTIIISAGWDWYLRKHGSRFTAALAETISTLRLRGKRVIVLGSIPVLPHYDRACRSKSLKLGFLDCRGAASVPEVAMLKLRETISGIAAENGATYIDFNAQLCAEAHCFGYRGDRMLYFDDSHLSRWGSRELGLAAWSARQDKRLFRSLAPGD